MKEASTMILESLTPQQRELIEDFIDSKLLPMAARCFRNADVEASIHNSYVGQIAAVLSIGCGEDWVSITIDTDASEHELNYCMHQLARRLGDFHFINRELKQ